MQMKNSKKIFILFLIIILTCSVFINIVQAVNETASDPGSDGDPLVSKSYVDSSINDITAKIQQLQLLQEKYNQLLLSIDTLKNQIQKTSAKSYEFIPIEQGHKFFAGMGTEVILIAGKANSIKGNNGGLIDTNTAKQLLTVSPITLNHLLISAANDGRGLITVTKCYLLIKGTYSIDSKTTETSVVVPETTPGKVSTPTPTPTPVPAATTKPTGSFVGSGIINTAILNLREKADVNSKILTKLSKGQIVSIITFTDEWYKIKTADGFTGWTLGKYIVLKNN